MEDCRCLLCGSYSMENYFSDGWQPVGVTSDVRLHMYAPHVYVCQECGHVQHSISAVWKDEVDAIYKDYSVYAISDADDHQIFDAFGNGVSRAKTVADKLAYELKLPEKGRLLDFGCGSGNFLKAFHEIRPKWELHGCDIGTHFTEYLQSLPGVKGFHNDMSTLPYAFDLITMCDVVEHLQDPVGQLRNFKQVLQPGGCVFSRCPDYTAHPFDMIVVDHASHFSPSSTQELLRLAGFRPVLDANKWFPRVTAFCATPYASSPSEIRTVPNVQSPRILLEWLRRLPEYFSKKSASRRVGVFGAAIAGLWIAEMLAPSVEFFVDEDPARCGHTLNGLPILCCSSVPENTAIILAFPPDMARMLYQRFSVAYPNIFFITPPDFEM